MQKTVLITGASGNLGKAVVRKFVTEGYHVVAVVAPGETSGQDTNGVELYEADLTNENSANGVVQQIISKHEVVHAALLLVGGYAFGGLSITDGALMKRMITLNFDTAYFVARPLFEHMKAQAAGGKIVFIGSKPSLNPKEGKNSLAYALSKSLLFKLSDFLNAEGAPQVTSAVVAPSILDTEPNRRDMPKADFAKWVKVEEVADILAFLCSGSGAPLRETVLKIYGQS